MLSTVLIGLLLTVFLKLSPTEIAKKQIRRVDQSTEDYKVGINAVTEAPGMAAAKKEEKMRINLLASLDSGKWRDHVSRVTLESWKKSTLEKGAARLSSGIHDAEPKIIAFHEKFDPFLDAAMAKVNAMPDTTYEQRKAKASAMMDEIHKFKN